MVVLPKPAGLDFLAFVIARCLEAEEALTRREANTRGRTLSGR